MAKNYIERVKELKKQIQYELEAIEEHKGTIDSLEDEITEYERSYDYESDPNGDDYDLHYISSLREEIESYERMISRCEWEIQLSEEELTNLEFWLGDSSLQSLLQKWETKLNTLHQKRNDIVRDNDMGSYENDGDYQNDIGRVQGEIHICNTLIDDIKHIIESTEGNSFPKFESIEDAYNYYWDMSRNPYDMYEVSTSLIEGERDFVKKCGFDWDEWCSINKNPIND